MIWQMKALVREVKSVKKNKDGKELSNPFDVVTFVDVQTGGDVSLNFALGAFPYKVGETPSLEVEVKGQVRGFNISYWAVELHNSPAPAKKA